MVKVVLISAPDWHLDTALRKTIVATSTLFTQRLTGSRVSNFHISLKMRWHVAARVNLCVLIKCDTWAEFSCEAVI